MRGFTVFYSWQADLPRKITRDFIHDAAASAIQRLAIGMCLEDAPRLDQDTLGISGVPAIGETILGKIDRCSILLADVSFVGQTTRDDKEKKMMPNPNVLLELGYAAARIGWERIVLVLNTAYGDELELPFDLRFRRFPLGYTIAGDRSDFAVQQTRLSNNLEVALRTCVEAEHERVLELLQKLPGSTRYFMREHAHSQYFWETNLSKATMPTNNDLAIQRMLELEYPVTEVAAGGRGKVGR